MSHGGDGSNDGDTAMNKAVTAAVNLLKTDEAARKTIAATEPTMTEIFLSYIKGYCIKNNKTKLKVLGIIKYIKKDSNASKKWKEILKKLNQQYDGSISTEVSFKKANSMKTKLWTLCVHSELREVFELFTKSINIQHTTASKYYELLNNVCNFLAIALSSLCPTEKVSQDEYLWSYSEDATINDTDNARAKELIDFYIYETTAKYICVKDWYLQKLLSTSGSSVSSSMTDSSCSDTTTKILKNLRQQYLLSSPEGKTEIKEAALALGIHVTFDGMTDSEVVLIII